MKMTKEMKRQRVHYRVRKIVSGTAERPRLAIYRSGKQIYVQAIDDQAGTTLAAASSIEKEFRSSDQTGATVDGAKIIGAHIAQRLLDKGITNAVFDRGGYRYHGRVKALADAAREAGLKI